MPSDRFIAFLAIAGIVLGCAGEPPAPAERIVRPTPTDAPTPPTLRSVSLGRGGCLGTCPIYTLTITAEGEVEWLGRGFVRTIGAASKRVDPSLVEPLLADLAAFDFSEVPDEFHDPRCEVWVTDHPWASVTLTFSDGQQRSFTRVGGCLGNAAYEALQALERRIDELAELDAWIDRDYVDCVFHPIAQLDRETFVLPAIKERPLFVSASELPDWVAKILASDPSMRLRVVSHASVRNGPGASRARADAFVSAVEAAGGDLARIEVLNCDTDLAERAADDQRIWIDERLEFEFFTRDCLDRKAQRP